MRRVKKRNGRLEELNVNKINKVVERACLGLDNVSASEIILDAELGLPDKVRTEDIDTQLILTARAKVYEHPEYSIVAARLLLNCIYKEVFKESVDCDTFESDYKSAFIRNIKKQVKEGRLDPRNLDYNLRRLADAIEISRDDKFNYVSLQNIKDRYLLRKSGDKKLFETPQAYYMRIAMGLCYNEDEKEKTVIELYNMFSNHLSSPSTPTLFNSATNHNQLSSCYLSEIDDSVDGIFDGLWQEARKSKYAGGLGFHVTKIRAMGSNIKGTNGRSSGLIPWLKVYNDMLIACDQAGKRQGSGCAYLEPWHLDVEDFVDLRKETGEERRRCHDLNTALWCPDLFFKRIKNNDKWTLFCPSETSDLPDLYGEDFNKKYEEYEKMAEDGEIKGFKVIKAKDLWKIILKSLFETSHPWIAHKDNANMRYSNIHEGVLHGSNLCMEIFLHTKHSEYDQGIKTNIGETAVCNLASIVLPSHVVDGKLDKDTLAKTVELTVRGLNNVIDINFYPTKEAEKSNLAHRPIGLGTMGFSNLCHKLNIVQDSDEGVALADEVAEFISYHAILTSSKLAKRDGKYSSYEGSKWSQNIFPIDTYNQLMKWKNVNHVDAKESDDLDWEYVRNHVKEYGMRNSNTMAIAPNACLDKDTMIVTSEGIKRISSFHNKVDDWLDYKVDILKDIAKGSTSKVYHNGVVSSKEIKTESGSFISATDNHRLRVIDNGEYVWKYCRDLRVGDKLVKRIGGHESLLSDKSYIKMNYDVVSSRAKPLSKDKYYMNEEIALLCGLYMGDGHIKSKKNGSFESLRIAFNKHSEKDLALEVKEIFKRVFGYDAKIEDEGRNCLSLNICSKNVCELFSQNDMIKNKSEGAFIPNIILESRTSVLCAFFRGLFLSDGSISNKIISLSSVSEEMIDQALVCLESLGIQVHKYKGTLGTYGSKPCFSLRTKDAYSAEIFRNKILTGSSNKEKREIHSVINHNAYRKLRVQSKELAKELYDSVSNNTKLRPNWLRLAQKTSSISLKSLKDLVDECEVLLKNSFVNLLERSDYSLITEDIVEINDVICDTYDFEVPGDHQYISSSFVSHNSIAYQMGCTQSIEPDKAVLFIYENKSGNYYLLSEEFVQDMEKEGVWSKEFAEQLREHDGLVKDLDIPDKYKSKYRNAFDRDQFKLIEANAARQKWIDMGVSFNSWNNKTSLKYLNDIYAYSNELGLKSNYYLRGIAASQVAKSSNKKVEVVKEEVPEQSEQEAKDACSLDALMNGGTCVMCEG